MAATQLSATWRKVLNFTTTATKFSNIKISDEKPSTDTSQPKRSISRKNTQSKEKVTPETPIDNASASPLLRLPAEIRNQIYLYVVSDYIIEVLMLAKSAFIPLDSKGLPLKHNPYPKNAQLWFRLEDAFDRPFNFDDFSAGVPKRRRCKTVPGLFAISQVCSQVRAETLYLLLQKPAFVFTDERYNHTFALPAFVASLSIPQLHAIQTIRWPFSQARNYRFSNMQRRDIEKPDVKLDREFGELLGLKRVVLKFRATDVSHGKVANDDMMEWRSIEENTQDYAYNYSVEQQFRRDLGIRGMRTQLSDREDVEIVCERM